MEQNATPRAVVEGVAHVWTDSPTQRVHLVLSSGRHSNGYVNFDPASVDTDAVWFLARELAQCFFASAITSPLFNTQQAHPRKLVVVTPPWGSFRLADYFVVNYGIFAESQINLAMIEKDDDSNFFIDREGHREALNGADVIIIEDVSTTGKNTRKVAGLAESYGGRIVAVGSVWNRGGVTNQQLDLGEEVINFTLIDEVLQDWDRANCPLCAELVPVATDLGHGAKFQTQNPDYPGGFTTLRG